MIRLSRINGKSFYLNHELIETVEETPDTLVRLTTGQCYIVSESPSEIAEMVKRVRVESRQKVDEVLNTWT